MLQSLYPVIMTEKLQESCHFYKEVFGFTESYTSDWYISLMHPEGCELALIDAQHETIPEASRGCVQGMFLNIEVKDAKHLFHKLSDASADFIIQSLQDEAYGQRHFMLQDPNNVLIDVIQVISPNEEYQSNYQVGAKPA